MVLLHKIKELHKYVMSMLGTYVSFKNQNEQGKMKTFAVVLLHETKALEAALMASCVSSKPISGTVPSISFVAGSSQG